MWGESYGQTIIQMLIDSDSEYVSGQNISDKLGITRAAVWKEYLN